jgi:microcin C transport system permease protein
MGYASLWIFMILFGLSMGAELIANDKPLIVRYEGKFYFPIVKSQPERVFGGDFATPTDFLDPDIRYNITSNGNWAIYPPIPYSYETLNYFSKVPNPAPPSLDNWLGTDDRGRDILSRLIYGFRLSILFGLALTIVGVSVGIITGSLMGFFGGKFDLVSQRLIEIWSAMPELYLLIIFASIFNPSIWLLIILLAAFGWMGLSDYVRAEFFRNRALEYVRAARALGLTNLQIMWRHILPNTLAPITVQATYICASAMIVESILSFIGAGTPPIIPSWGNIMAEGRALWQVKPYIVFFPAIFLSITVLAVNLLGDGLRDALDPRMAKRI